MLGRGLVVTDLEYNSRVFGFSFADSVTFTTIFVQKRIDNFVNSMNDGKIKIRFRKGSVEISSNVDVEVKMEMKESNSGNTVQMDMSDPVLE